MHKILSEKTVRKIAAALVAVSLVFVGVLVLGASSANAQTYTTTTTTTTPQPTVDQLTTMVAQLQAELQALLSGGNVSAGYVFAQNLTVGSRGADVVQLQTYLESKGFLVMPVGVAKGYFGPLTRAALASFQASVGISPAAGFFGPITRAYVNAQLKVVVVVPPPVVVTTIPGCGAGATYSSVTGQPCNYVTNQPVLDGTDGSITVSYSPFAPSSQSLKKGDTNKPIIAVKLQATSGKVTVNRLDVEFSDRPWLYFSKLTLKDSDGNVIATKTLSSANDATEITVGSDYLVRFDNVNYSVDPSKDVILVAYLDVLASSDKINNNVVKVGIPSGDIRSINGRGYTDSLGISSGTGSDVASNGVALTLSSTGSTGTIYTRVSPNSPLKRIVATSATQITPDVVLGIFGLKVQNQNATVNSLNFNINNSTAIATSTLYQNVRLYNGSQLIAGANSLVAGAATFNNLTIPLTQDVWTDLTLKADVNINQTGVSASSTLVAAGIVGTDSNYNTLTLTSATNQTSTDNQYSISGISIGSQSAALGTCTGQTNTTSNNKCDMTMSFTVTNVSNTDVFISKNPAIALATSSTPSTASSTLQSINIVAGPNDTAQSYDIASGASRTFTYQGTFSQVAGGGFESFQITGIRFGTVGTTDGTSSAGGANTVTTAASNASSVISFGLEPLFVSKTL